MVFEATKRRAINTPVQGTAAEIMKMGMLKTLKRLNSDKIDAQLLLQVHDEVIFSVHKDDLNAATKAIQEELESVVEWPFPLKVSVSSGKSWSDLSK
jgi:DNA polymerase-1